MRRDGYSRNDGYAVERKVERNDLALCNIISRKYNTNLAN